MKKEQHSLGLTQESFHLTLAVPYHVTPPAPSPFTCISVIEQTLYQATTPHVFPVPTSRRNSTLNNTTVRQEHFTESPDQFWNSILPVNRSKTRYTRPVNSRFLDTDAVRELAGALDHVYKARFQEAHDLYSSITNLLSQPISDKQARSKRYTLQTFEGPGSSGLFGLALGSQIDKITSHILTIDQWINYQDTFQNRRDEIISGIAQRQLVIMETLNKQKQAFSTLLTNFSSQFKVLMEHFNVKLMRDMRDLYLQSRIFHSFFAKLTELISLNEYIIHYSKFRQNIRLLKTHKLPVDFLTENDIGKLYVTAQRFLDNHFPNISQYIMTDLDIYKCEISLFLYSSKYIYAYLQIPIIPPNNVFDLYSIHIFPVPFQTHTANQTGYTQINLPYAYFAINEIGSFLELTKDDKLDCNINSNMVICPSYFPVKRPHFRTCLASLWDHNMSEIYKLCTFTAYPLAAIPAISYHIKDDLYAVSFPDNEYTIQCPFSTNVKQKSPCALCFIRIPCECIIKTSNVEISGMIATCQNTSKIQVELYTVNLPLSYAFNMSILHLKSDFAYSSPIILQLPNISQVIEDIHTFSRDDFAEGLDLSQMADAILEMDRMQKGMILPVAQLKDIASNPLTIAVLILLHIITYLCLIFLLYKYRGLAKITPFLANKPTLAVPVFNPDPSQPLYLTHTTQNPALMTFDLAEYQAHLVAVILALILIVLIFKSIHFIYVLCKRCMMHDTVKSDSIPHLCIKINAANRTFLLPLLHLYADSADIKIIKLPKLLQMSFTRSLTQIFFKWSGEVRMSIRNQSQVYFLPKSLKISFLARYILAKFQPQDENFHYTFALIHNNTFLQIFPINSDHPTVKVHMTSEKSNNAVSISPSAPDFPMPQDQSLETVINVFRKMAQP